MRSTTEYPAPVASVLTVFLPKFVQVWEIPLAMGFASDNRVVAVLIGKVDGSWLDGQLRAEGEKHFYNR